MQAKPFRERQKVRTGDLRAIRREMSTCYSAWQRGEIDDGALRSGSLALSRMAAIDQGVALDARLVEVERLLGTRSAQNGHNHHAPARA